MGTHARWLTRDRIRLSGSLEGFKEAAGGSRFLMAMQSDDNELMAALSKEQARKRPPDIEDREGLASERALDRIRQAAGIDGDKAPEVRLKGSQLVRNLSCFSTPHRSPIADRNHGGRGGT